MAASFTFRRGFYYWFDSTKDQISMANDPKFIPQNAIVVKAEKTPKGDIFTFIAPKIKSPGARAHEARVHKLSPVFSAIKSEQDTKTGVNSNSIETYLIGDDFVVVFPRGYRPCEKDYKDLIAAVVCWDDPEEAAKDEAKKASAAASAAKTDDGTAKTDDDTAKTDDSGKKTDDATKADDGAAKTDDDTAKTDDSGKKTDDDAAKTDDATKADDGTAKTDDATTALVPVDDCPSSSEIAEAILAGKLSPEKAMDLISPKLEILPLFAGSDD